MMTKIFIQLAIIVSAATTLASNNLSLSIINPNFKNHPELRLYVNQARSTQAKPARIIFIHGTPSSSKYFKNYLQNEQLQNSADLLTYDRPGFGKSDNNTMPFSLDEQAQAVIEIMNLDHSNAQPVILVAASYGSMIALKVAQMDSRIKGVITLAGVYDLNSVPSMGMGSLVPKAMTSYFPRSIQNANYEIQNFKKDLAAVLEESKNASTMITNIPGDEKIAFEKSLTIREKILSMLSRLQN